MDEIDFLARRKFLSKNAPEIFDALASCQRTLKKLSQFSKCNSDIYRMIDAEETHRINFIDVAESLKNASDNEFLLVCHSILECGRYSLFTQLLDQHFVDCESLEALTVDFVEDKFFIILDILKGRRRVSEASRNVPLSAYQREFLRRHEQTLRCLLRLDKLPDYLNCTGVFLTEQSHVTQGLPSCERLNVLVDFLTSQQISTDSLHRFCHGLLLTGQYRLYSIMHDIVDAKRLEIFFSEYSRALMENDENFQARLASNLNERRIFTASHRSAANVMLERHNGNIRKEYGAEDEFANKNNTKNEYGKKEKDEYTNGSRAGHGMKDEYSNAKISYGNVQLMECHSAQTFAVKTEEVELEFDVNDEEDEFEIDESTPHPDGLLKDLSVDMADSNSLREFYEINKHEVYKNFSAPKGLAMIINNCNFQFQSKRHGTAVDVRNITNLLTQLGYRVLPPHEDLTAARIRDQARRFALCRDHQRLHSCVVVVLSHGGYDSITGVDGASVSTFEFFSIFNAKNAPYLAGKPRIFIMQACRGELHDAGIERLIDYDEPDGCELLWKQKSYQLTHNLKTSKHLLNADLFDDNSNVSNASSPTVKTSSGLLSRIGQRFGFSSTRSSSNSSVSSSGRADRHEQHQQKHQLSRSESTPPRANDNVSQASTSPLSVGPVLVPHAKLNEPFPTNSIPACAKTIAAEEERRRSNAGGLPRIPVTSNYATSGGIYYHTTTTASATSVTSGALKGLRSLRHFFPEELPKKEDSPSSSSFSRSKRQRLIREPTDSDMLIAYATTPNYVSWRNSEYGTWFIQSICEIFSKHAKHEDILTMLTRVNQHVASKFKSSNRGEKQIPECTNRLRRKFYFFPGWHEEKTQLSTDSNSLPNDE